MMRTKEDGLTPGEFKVELLETIINEILLGVNADEVFGPLYTLGQSPASAFQRIITTFLVNVAEKNPECLEGPLLFVYGHPVGSTMIIDGMPKPHEQEKRMAWRKKK